MQEDKGLVSIVIPVYNAGAFIGETLRSIIDQSYENWEIIIVDDGSTDNTKQQIDKIFDSRIYLIAQQNSGVSLARNKGLSAAKGEFIVFFDADDLMTPDFLEVRTALLNKENDIGFVGGWVESFPVKSELKRATAEDPEGDIHFFNENVVTIPSNYMFRTSVILRHSITFNPKLSSSADRFFLLQVAKYTRGACLDSGKGKLLYRVNELSMSHHITPKLITDYHNLYKELSAHRLFPEKKRGEIRSRYLFSIASGFALVRRWSSSFKLMFGSFATHPIVFTRLLFNKKYRNRNKNYE